MFDYSLFLDGEAVTYNAPMSHVRLMDALMAAHQCGFRPTRSLEAGALVWADTSDPGFNFVSVRVR